MLSNVTTKGQVTIPKALRDRFNIKPNDKVDFSSDGERIILKPIKTLKDFRGFVKGKGGMEKERSHAKAAVARRVMDEMQ